MNAETLATQFATLEHLIDSHSIDTSRLRNLDETGSNPGRDQKGQRKVHVYMGRSSAHEMRMPEFVRASRATLMACVSAEGETGSRCLCSRGGACRTAMC